MAATARSNVCQPVQQFATLGSNVETDGPGFLNRPLTMPIYRQLGPLVRHEEFVVDVSIFSFFIAVKDKPRKQFVVSNRWNVRRVNHLQIP